MKFLSSLIIPLGLILARTNSSSIQSCLMQKELYSRDTKTCWPPLLKGPCPPGEWVVLQGVEGEGVCMPRVKCPAGRVAFLNPEGGVACHCPDGEEDVGGSCEQVFSQGSCQEGEVLMPKSLTVGSGVCSAGFSCKKSGDCPAFSHIDRKETRSNKVQLGFLKDMVCNKRSRSLCCPENNQDSLFTVQNLVQSMVPRRAQCVKNPCEDGLWPWLHGEGVIKLKCLKAGKEVEKCSSRIIEEDGRLTCEYISIRTVAPRAGKNCGRRKRWMYGKCRRIFA